MITTQTQLLQGSIFSLPQGLSEQQQKHYCNTWVKPYLSLAYKFPNIPFFFYVSGALLEVFEVVSKECRDVLLELLERKQIELLSGFFYDCAPILQVKADQREQLEKQNHFIARKYNVKTKGLWITPGTYDSSVIPVLKNSGAHYIFTERAYLESTSQTFNFGMVEVLGESLNVFPYDKKHIHKMASLEESKIDNLIKKIFFPNDIENTGNYVQPQVLLVEYDDVVDKEVFFRNLHRLQQNILSKQLEPSCVLPATAQKFFGNNKVNLCRVRTTPYGDEDNESFLKQIMYKPESRLLYGFLQHYTKKVKKYKKDKTRKRSAQLLLSENQSHYPFWSLHRSWGIHDMKVRQNTYKNFVSIENTLRNTKNTKKEKQILYVDIDVDGEKEFVIFSPTFMSVIETHNGSLCMLQRLVRSKIWNYSAGYTGKYSVKQNVEDKVVNAPWSFREMFLSLTEDTRRLHNQIIQRKKEYKFVNFTKAVSNEVLSSLILSQNKNKKEQNTTSNTEEPFVSVEKQYLFKTSSLQTSYRFTNNTAEEKKFQFSVELNLSFLNDKDALDIITNVDSKTEKKITSNGVHSIVTNKIKFLHHPLKEQLILEMPENSKVHITPMYYRNMDLQEMYYQHTSIMIVWTVTVESVSYDEKTLTLSFSPLTDVKKE